MVAKQSLRWDGCDQLVSGIPKEEVLKGKPDLMIVHHSGSCTWIQGLISYHAVASLQHALPIKP